MQLACILTNLGAQKSQNLDKIFIEMQKNLPKNFVGERQKCLKIEKTARFQPATRQHFA